MDDEGVGESDCDLFHTVALPELSNLRADATRDAVKHESEREENLPQVGHLATFGEVLGRGGNGVVVSAEQAGLGRRIAVKRPLLGHEAPGLLLREARVIGYLEHPNIPPVHFAGTDASGTLLVGLKQIAGETLDKRLKTQHGLEHLEENLEILMQVSNAVGFAHTRGILHLDLKPENIMTGLHGEVYVLDWGIAVAYRGDVSPGIARPPTDGGLRYGTPAFVAPETVAGELPLPATDVYQLGGLLYFMLTKCPPNAGVTQRSALKSSSAGTPRAFPKGLPAALIDICKRALALAPEDRYADATELRAALIDFRRDRQSNEALATAERELAAFSSLLQNFSEDAAEVYQTFGRARQAIDAANGAQAQALLQSVLELLIRWELERKNVGSAALLLSELPKPNHELATVVKELKKEHTGQMAELRALRDEIDPEIGRKSKIKMLLAVGVLNGLAQVIPLLLGIRQTPMRILVGYCIYLALMTGATFYLRDQLFRTRLNRGLTLALWLLASFGLILRIGGYQGLLPLHAVIGYDLALVALITAYCSIQLDPRISYVVPSYAAFALAAFVWPTQAILLFGSAHFFGLTMLACVIAFQRPPAMQVDEPSLHP